MGGWQAPAATNKPKNLIVRCTRLAGNIKMPSEDGSIKEKPKNGNMEHRGILGKFQGFFLEVIVLKAPGNHSASCWSIFSILLWERPKPNISMISGFLDP